MATPTFAAVKAILDGLIASWTAQHGHAPNLTVHDDNFGWDTKKQLAEAVAFDNRLIAEDLVGNGKAKETNLYRVLTGTLPGFPRMPKGGPYIGDNDLATLAAWIDANMPD